MERGICVSCAAGQQQVSRGHNVGQKRLKEVGVTGGWVSEVRMREQNSRLVEEKTPVPW